MNLNEAFQKLNLLESEDFDISLDSDGKKLDTFLDTDETDDSVEIIDTETDSKEDMPESYDGKIVTECCVCHSKFYKDPSEIILDGETGNCNLDEECPVCFSMDGYKIIGKIEPVDLAELDGEEPTDDNIEDVDDIDETEDDDLDEGLIGTALGGLAGGALGHPVVGAVAGNAIGDAVGNLLDDNKNECLDEDINSATIETDDSILSMDSDQTGRVTITNSPVGAAEPGADTMVPLEVEDAEAIAANQPEDEEEAPEDEEFVDEEEEVEVPIDDFDEESFDDLGESYLRRVYENVNSYKTTKTALKDGKLVVEGIINFKSGKDKKTSFIFESYTVNKNGRVKFIGENAQITKGRKAFTVTGNVNEKKFITESFNYNYRQKDASGNSTKLYGTVRR